MPCVRISLLEGKPPSYLQAISDSIQAAMEATIGIAANQRFQIFEELKKTHYLVSSPLVGIEHSENVVTLHITFNVGRTLETKKRLFQQLTSNLSQNPGIQPEDVIILLVDLPSENWSFGKGLATLVA